MQIFGLAFVIEVRLYASTYPWVFLIYHKNYLNNTFLTIFAELNVADCMQPDALKCVYFKLCRSHVQAHFSLQFDCCQTQDDIEHAWLTQTDISACSALIQQEICSRTPC